MQVAYNYNMCNLSETDGIVIRYINILLKTQYSS